MGCASSSPLVNGGLVDSAKTAATEMMNTGEKAMNGKFLITIKPTICSLITKKSKRVLQLLGNQYSVFICNIL